jgi:hypothetical protein
VEGDGEVQALPVLLRRLADWLAPGIVVDIQTPIRVRRDRFLNRPEEFHRFISLARGKAGPSGWILTLLDADDDCPAKLAATIINKAQPQRGNINLSVVIANREYEAWFIAAAASLNGKRGFVFSGNEVSDPEKKRAAKEWIKGQMAQGRYNEITDQPALSQHMSLDLARRKSRSFQKLCKEFERMIESNP